MKKSIVATMMTVMLFLSAYEAVEERRGEVGVAVGALLGSKIGGGNGQLVATAAGAVAGRRIGSEIGKTLYERDRELAKANAGDTLENSQSGETGSWNNPDSGNSGTIRPVNTYYG